VSVLPRGRVTEAEYLAFERDSREKHQFVDGAIVAMSGARIEHNRVAGGRAARLTRRA
jgi:hypothetical protein